MIETQRLLLRPPIDCDFEAFAAAQADPLFKKHTGGIMPRTRAFEEFSAWCEFWSINKYCFFSVIEKESGEWIGRVGPTRRARAQFHELGWAIIPQFQGVGYAYEASAACVNWVRETLNWREIIFRIGLENKDSQKLAKKLGAINIGLENPPLSDAMDVEIWLLRDKIVPNAKHNN